MQKKRIKETNIIKSSSKYGKTKFLAENYLKKKFMEKRINFCIGRIFSIFDNKSVGFLLPSLKNKHCSGHSPPEYILPQAQSLPGLSFGRSQVWDPKRFVKHHVGLRGLNFTCSHPQGGAVARAAHTGR